MAVFAFIAILAIVTAAGTTQSWFSAAVSAQVYATSLVAAIVVAVALAAVAVSQAARFEDARRAVVLRIASLPEADLLPTGDSPAVTAEAIKMIPPSDEEVDELLTTLATPALGAPPGAEIEVAGTLVEVSAALTAARTRKELLKALLRERALIDASAARIRPSVTGPIVMCLLFAFAAGAMLPGTEGFATVNFQLNTGLILFLSYGLAFLVTWALVALESIVSRPAEPGASEASGEKSNPSRKR